MCAESEAHSIGFFEYSPKHVLLTLGQVVETDWQCVQNFVKDSSIEHTVYSVHTKALLFKLCQQEKSLITNSINGLSMLGEIEIMSKVYSKQLSITHSVNVCKCRWNISSETFGLQKTSSTVLSRFIHILFSPAQCMISAISNSTGVGEF